MKIVVKTPHGITLSVNGASHFVQHRENGAIEIHRDGRRLDVVGNIGEDKITVLKDDDSPVVLATREDGQIALRILDSSHWVYAINIKKKEDA